MKLGRFAESTRAIEVAGDTSEVGNRAVRGIFGVMGNQHANGVHLVLALKGAKSEIWVAATPQSDAVHAVQVKLEKGWKAVRIVDTQLTPERIASLKLRPSGVRKVTTAQ
jgi:hypothetical protein